MVGFVDVEEKMCLSSCLHQGLACYLGKPGKAQLNIMLVDVVFSLNRSSPTLPVLVMEFTITLPENSKLTRLPSRLLSEIYL